MSEKLFILGHPIGHSKSPAMYNALYPALGLDWTYEFADIPDEDRARAFLAQRDFLSINITTPYKPHAYQAADVRDASAVLAHGANVLLKDTVDGETKLVAYNVDGEGCTVFLQLAGVKFEGAQVTVCGTGPTSLAIFHACVQAGANATLMGRDAQRSAAAVERYLSERAQAGLDAPTRTCCGMSYEQGRQVLADSDVIINATPLGMNPGDPAPFDTDVLHPGQVVFDCVYGHGETALRKAAEQAGCTAYEGAGMLVAQAVAGARRILKANGYDEPLDEAWAFNVMAQGAGFDLHV